MSQQIRTTHDFIICGAGSAGCVIAARLTENPEVRVLLIEAGGSDQTAAVKDPKRWSENLSSDRDWQFKSEPNFALAGRSIPLSMGKVLGGGSGINALQWMRGHKNDWDMFADETGEPGWNYESVCDIYRRIENWHGPSDPVYRGLGGPVHLEPALAEGESTPILVEAAQSIGIPTYANANGAMSEGVGGAAVLESITYLGERYSAFRAFVGPVLDRRNLTVLTDALVTQVQFQGRQAKSVTFYKEGRSTICWATCEVVLCLGAIGTPKVLLQSGIGDEANLRRFGIPVVQLLPGVGQNFQDHLILFGVVYRFNREGVTPNASRAVLQWKSKEGIASPDIQILQSDGGQLKTIFARQGLKPSEWWSLAPGLIRPKSRGHLELTGPGPSDPIRIFGDHLTEPEDLEVILRAIDICRELAAAPSLRNYVGDELLPRHSGRDELVHFVRDQIGTYWHQSCTARMGQDEDAVVDGSLRVRGIERLRVADASVLPRVATGNTMGPCMVIGERASDLLRAAHGC